MTDPAPLPPPEEPPLLAKTPEELRALGRRVAAGAALRHGMRSDRYRQMDVGAAARPPRAEQPQPQPSEDDAS